MVSIERLVEVWIVVFDGFLTQTGTCLGVLGVKTATLQYVVCH